MQEIQLGALTFVGEKLGSHVHVTILGAGQRGARPLCGKVTVRVGEWESLQGIARELVRLGREVDRLDGVAKGLAAAHADLRLRLERNAEGLDDGA